jgi:iron(III) transport system substrate-binding protein
VRWFTLIPLLMLTGCRIESASRADGPAAATPAASELWVYTSMYRHVLDALQPQLAKAMPTVTIHYFQAGSEKIAAKLEAELAAGGTPCDVLITSDPFLYQRFKGEGRWARYVSPNGLRTPARYIDPDGHFASVRLSTMVLIHRTGTPAPESFASLTSPLWKGEVAVGDPLTSGTALTWAVSMDHALGPTYFRDLRANDARVAGGNAAVLQKVEGGEAKVGVLLLENALAAKAKGSPLDIAWPADGAVVIPGYAGIFAHTRHLDAARALIDALLSPEGQAVIAQQGDMHAVDPRIPGPRGTVSLQELVSRSAPWDEALLAHGLEAAPRVKADFGQAFSQ